MKSSPNILKRFDAFGQPISFTDNGHTSFKSNAGGIATIASLLVWLWCMVYYVSNKNEEYD